MFHNTNRTKYNAKIHILSCLYFVSFVFWRCILSCLYYGIFVFWLTIPLPLVKKFYWLKMIYTSWNEFCMIRVHEYLQDCLAREFRSEKFSSGEKTPTPPKNKKNKFVLKCFLVHFEWFLLLFFLVENWPILTLTPTPRLP